MTVTAAVLLVALVAGLVVTLVSISRHPLVDPIDPTAEERWLVHRLARVPRLAAFAKRRVDPTVATGVVLTGCLATLLAATVGVALLLDMVDENRGLARLDSGVARWGRDNADSVAVSVLRVVTDLGGTPVAAAVLVVVGIVHLLWRREPHVALFLAVVGSGVAVINNLLKEVVDRDRPSIGPLEGFSGSSFPSGHSATAGATWAAVALVVGRGRSRPVRALLAGAAALVAAAVAASRAMLGVHWLTDVIAGLVVGWGWFTLVAIAFGGRRQRFGEPVERLEVAVYEDRDEGITDKGSTAA